MKPKSIAATNPTTKTTKTKTTTNMTTEVITVKEMYQNGSIPKKNLNKQVFYLDLNLKSLDFFDKKIDKKSVKKKSMDHYGENEGYRNDNQNRYFKKQRRNQYDGYNNNYQDDYEDNVHKELDFNDIDKLVAQMDSKGKYSDIDLLYEKKLKSKEV